MSVESLRRVLLKIKGEAKEMRKEKYVRRLAPKPKEEKAESADSTVEAIRDLLEK